MKPTIRCSSLPRLLNCHGSDRLIRLVRARRGDEGWEGSMLHWMTADRLVRECGARPVAGGLPPPDVPKDYQIPRPNRWIVDWNLRQVATHCPPTHAMIVEDELIWEFDRFYLKGHIDVYTVDAGGLVLVGIDWKTGYIPVTAAELNDQILGYIVLLFLLYPTAQSVKFVVAQPRNSEADGFPRVTIVELDRAALEACVSSLEARVNEALDDQMTVDSGPIQCSWCPVGLQCPAWREEFEFMKAHLTEEMLASIRDAADDGLLGDIIIASRTVARALEDAEQLLKARIREQGQLVAANGTRITIKEEGGQYKIINPEGAFEAVKELIPAARIPHVVKYNAERLVDEIAAANNVAKGGQADTINARTLFEILLRPHMEQGKREKLVFTP